MQKLSDNFEIFVELCKFDASLLPVGVTHVFWRFLGEGETDFETLTFRTRRPYRFPDIGTQTCPHKYNLNLPWKSAKSWNSRSHNIFYYLLILLKL